MTIVILQIWLESRHLANNNIHFKRINLSRDSLVSSDLIIVRDLLVHLKNDDIFCEWASFPDMVKKPEFLENLLSHLNLEKSDNIFFICRSGARSFQAALELVGFLAESGKAFSGISCFNVKYGFEGGLSDHSKRGGINGWKFSNLPWQQL